MADEPQLTVEDIASRLGAHPATVRRWLNDGTLRGYRPGGTKLGWRIRKSEFDRFIAEREGRAAPASEEG